VMASLKDEHTLEAVRMYHRLVNSFSAWTNGRLVRVLLRLSFVFCFALLFRSCVCFFDVHLCSLHSAHANFTTNTQLLFYTDSLYTLAKTIGMTMITPLSIELTISI
jgi:hypothetical protein